MLYYYNQKASQGIPTKFTIKLKKIYGLIYKNFLDNTECLDTLKVVFSFA